VGRALLALLCLVAVAAPVNARTGGDVWGADYFPKYELTAHTGETLRFFDDVIKGKVVAINFIFTSCTDVCPMETARMAAVHELLADRVGEDVFFYSITIDPEHDTVEVLRDYAARFGIDGSNWKFLTGDKKEIDTIRERFGLYGDPREEQDLSNHNINLVIGNQATGQWLRRSPFENPYVLADQLGGFLHGYKKRSGLTRANFAEAPALRQISSGEMMFRDRCASCHVISGGLTPARNAAPLGPDLFGVTDRRDDEWLRRWLAEPDKMIEEGDPIASAMAAQWQVVMPNFRLDDREIDALVRYMSAETRRLQQRHSVAAHSDAGSSPPAAHKTDGSHAHRASTTGGDAGNAPAAHGHDSHHKHNHTH
jgi:protein SCO1/2